MEASPAPKDIRFHNLVEVIRAILDLSVEISFDSARYDTKSIEQLGRAARILASTCERVSNL